MKLRLTNKEHIRSVTNPRINAKIDNRIEENIRRYAYQGDYEISYRINELELEWDIERVFLLNSSSFAMIGLLLSLKNKNWLIVSGTFLSFIILQTLKGFSPTIPLLRRLGLRTKQEIECEIFAMKFLKGDFSNLTSEGKRNADLAIKETLIAVR
ncbi:MAG: acyl-CoA reductase [Bacteroidota bacterium]|nr:acyl-CoA reductase [Bacteroidota bacterium]